MGKGMWGELSKEQNWLFHEAMSQLDGQFDSKVSLLGNEKDGHGVRASSHYALGLLARNENDDEITAKQVIRELLKLQYKGNPESYYYGTFRRNDREVEPPDEAFPGKDFRAGARYHLEKWEEKIWEKTKKSLLENGYTRNEVKEIWQILKQSKQDTVPVVWDGFDPNWREFLGVEFALILWGFEEKLDKELVKEIDDAMQCSVYGSIQRYENKVCPMNTNIELMHIFICAFYGERWNREDLMRQAFHAADIFEKNYQEFHGVSEYNSPTYYGVDLTVLSCGRQLLKHAELQNWFSFMEAQIWEDFSKFYHPGLKNLSGPFSRSYEMDMSIHTIIPSLLYLGLGEKRQERPVLNCELQGNIDIALLGTKIPEKVREALCVFQGNRQFEVKFRELIERAHPNDDTTVCTGTVWMDEQYMLGALRGSRNTSHQLRAATAYWKADDGSVMNLAVLRREPGEAFEHIRTVLFDNVVEKNKMKIHVTWKVERDMELVIQVFGTHLTTEMVTEGEWNFPGMSIMVKGDLPEVKVNGIAGGLEIIYERPWNGETSNETEMELEFVPQRIE